MTLGLTAAFPQARHEAAAAERRRKRDEALANASPEEAIEEGEVDWAGQRTELALEGLVDALRGAVDAANMRRPAAPLAFIAATLRGTQYEEPGREERRRGRQRQQEAVDAFAFMDSYEAELRGAMEAVLTEGLEGARATQRLAQLLDEAAGG